MKNFIRWFFGCICGLYLVLQIVVYIPPVQEILGATAASVLKTTFGWEVTIGRIRPGLWNRVIIDDIKLKDKQDSTLLHASRLAAKINLLPLVKGQISIANAQLFSAQAHIYQKTPQDKPNFQFLIDTFSSNDTTSSPLNLRIGSILLRHVSIDWHRQWIPETDSCKFDPSHLRIRNLAVTAHLKALTNDSINLSLKRLSFTEKSGISLKNLSFDLLAGEKGARINNFVLQLPHSTLTLPRAEATWPNLPKKGERRKWLKDISLVVTPSLELTPSDLSAFIPWLDHIDTPTSMQTTILFSESCLNIPSINISDSKSLNLSAKAFIYNVINNPEYTIELERLQTNASILQYLTYAPIKGSQKLNPIISRLDTINASGKVHFTDQKQDGTLQIDNKHGNLSINANASNWTNIDAHVSSNGLSLNRILSDCDNFAIGKASFEITAKGCISDANGKPDLNIDATFPELQWQGREYNDIVLNASLLDKTLETRLDLQDHGGDIHSQLTWKRDNVHKINGNISIDNFHTERMGLGKKYPGTRLSINALIDLKGSNIDNITGSIGIRDLVLRGSDRDSSLIVGPMSMSIATDVDKTQYRMFSIASTPLNVSAQGRFRFSTLATTIANSLHNKLPEFIPQKHTSTVADTMQFSVSLQDTSIIRCLARKDISIPQRIVLNGSIYGHDSLLATGYIPELRIGRELLRNGKIDIHGMPDATKAIISVERQHKKGFVALSLTADAHDNRLRLITSLDNNRQPRICGELDVTTTFARNANGTKDIRAWIAPSDLIISDTIWKVHPCAIIWDGQTADIRGFKVNQSKHRGIDINGRASASAEDTLHLNLQEINVEYILDLVNFKSVEFQGFATGSAYATGLLSKPNASANLTVNGFAFNHAPLGTLQARANWGNIPHFLSLDATISDPANQHLSSIKGGFNLGDKTQPNGMDLRVDTRNFNLAFMNLFTKDILEDFQGRSSGYCRIYGPFNAIDLEGDMMINYASFSLPMLGTTYSLQQDSVHIRPGDISIKALLADKYGSPIAHPFATYANTERNEIPHSAIVQGRFMHNHFKDMSYDLRVNANKFLGYDFKDFGESSFYATCIATGDININGLPGRLSVDIKATPEEGSVFTYNVATPDAITNADFITINSRDKQVSDITEGSDNQWTTTSGTHADNTANATSSDLYIDFDLPITTATQMRLLMDRKSGDMIEIAGNGRIRAKYYNKGRFNIYGTYRVQDGTYRMSLQDIIRKEFKFKPGGTIVFGGNAMKADLNLTAVYSVNSVSLDDLTKSSLGFSKTKVDCIMNLTGHPEQPVITFDFDLPNATEDERQMVRSVVSTEEERNVQAIYLLGLGRFYNFDADGGNQSSAAMNSLVSSTLSSHINELITTAVGSRNWHVNTYLQTSDDGWRNMDVEGQLSGSLLNNRLLLTGNFGYREKYYTQRNFISDVSIEYLLTRNGMLSVKAYNQANDRYFVQSSLNTQGIGLQYKRDFNHFIDLFPWLKRKNKEEKK